MKKSIFALFVLNALILSISFSSCQTPAEKVNTAQERVDVAQKGLDNAKDEQDKDIQKKADAAAWKLFKADADITIKYNETRIKELKEKRKSSGQAMDAIYTKSIDKMERSNEDLKKRMDAYDKGQSNWESFKSELSHDLDELGKSIKDFGVNNSK